MSNFIDETKTAMNIAMNSKDYENCVIRNQIELAKNKIKFAIEENKNYVGWCYGLHEHDSTYPTWNNFGPVCTSIEEYESNSNFYLDEHAGNNAVIDMIENYHGLRKALSLDFDYISQGIEKGLRDLGCKQVKVCIGLKPEKMTGWRHEKHFFGDRRTPYTYDETHLKWAIYASW